jgi:hypothetical protein
MKRQPLNLSYVKRIKSEAQARIDRNPRAAYGSAALVKGLCKEIEHLAAAGSGAEAHEKAKGTSR